MTTSEPTTEIVADLRFYLLVANKEKPTQLISTIARAADRLKSQEREIERLQKTIDRQDAVCYALTARAEQAERERDAAIKALTTYEDALFDERDKSYQSGFMDGFRSKEEIDDED